MLAVALVAAGAGCDDVDGTIARDLTVTADVGIVESELAVEAFELVAAIQGVAELEMLRVSIAPQERLVELTVEGDESDEVDRYIVVDGEVREPEPIQLGIEGVLEGSTFRPSAVPGLRQLERLARVGIEAVEFDDARVTSISVIGTTHPLEIAMSIESPRASGQVRFDADGVVIDVTRW